MDDLEGGVAYLTDADIAMIEWAASTSVADLDYADFWLDDEEEDVD